MIDDWRLVYWKETLWYNGLRCAVAGIAWSVISAIMNPANYMAMGLTGMIFTPIFLGVISIPLVLLCRVLAYIPLAGLIFGFLALIWFLPSDPFVYLLHKVKPEWVPVENPPLFSLNAWIFVMSPFKEY